ncbi:plasmid stabilization protein [Leclercia sp. LSNIH6]|jgi:mRNA-degrading endonuclease RelE of RelBE toxin-antitoxin system|nr:plasmid stabilization protein [Leclercia sp. LSNIH7]POU79000.1 plasmid stabilization protein [Leclercia sp. LSNIH6]POW53971.1 plasmid stabilization protein [Leclercia sp. LSNIH8]HCH39679.1 type II toxin-antitoxin system RelE/ParE family toxin [Enterobacter sp.]
MKIVWSQAAKKALTKIDSRYRQRIEAKLAQLNDRSAPQPDIKKISGSENRFRLRVGDYRIFIILQDNHHQECIVLDVKRRTTTTYLHEEDMPYGCSDH